MSGHYAQCRFLLQNETTRCWLSTYPIPGIVRIVDVLMYEAGRAEPAEVDFVDFHWIFHCAKYVHEHLQATDYLATLPEAM